MNEIQVDINGQIVTFWIAAAVGAALCLIYDLFRIMRYTRRPSKWSAFWQDVAWWCSCAVLTYLLMLVRCKGAVRIFALIGEGVGFVAFRISLSRLLLGAAKPIIRVCTRFAKWVKRKVLEPFCGLMGRVLKISLSFFEKFAKFLKKHLKRLTTLLYNPHSAHTKQHRNRGMKDESGKKQAG